MYFIMFYKQFYRTATEVSRLKKIDIQSMQNTIALYKAHIKAQDSRVQKKELIKIYLRILNQYYREKYSICQLAQQTFNINSQY